VSYIFTLAFCMWFVITYGLVAGWRLEGEADFNKKTVNQLPMNFDVELITWSTMVWYNCYVGNLVSN
jgi:hypothetical protein